MESPPTKKRKTASAGSDQGAKGGTKTKGREALQLPATVWVSVFQYLSLSDVMRALLISRSVAFDASKEVTELNVMRSSELDARISRRFPNVKGIYVYSLLSETSILNTDIAEGLVPFLISFNKLEACLAFPPSASSDYSSDYYDCDYCRGPANHAASYKEMLMSFSNAFKVNALRPDLVLHGIIGGTIPHITHFCKRTRIESEDEPCRFCQRICSNFPLFNVITLPCCLANEGGSFPFRHNLCFSTSTMASILKSRHWTDGCISNAVSAYDRLLVLKTVSPNELVPFLRVDSSIVESFVEALVSRGVSSTDDLHFLPGEQFDRIECLLDIQLGLEREGNLWSRQELMSVMNKDKPGGGYALIKRTFDRLVDIGFDLDAKDFILIDEEEEEALVAFRRARNE